MTSATPPRHAALTSQTNTSPFITQKNMYEHACRPRAYRQTVQTNRNVPESPPLQYVLHRDALCFSPPSKNSLGENRKLKSNTYTHTYIYKCMRAENKELILTTTTGDHARKASIKKEGGRGGGQRLNEKQKKTRRVSEKKTAVFVADGPTHVHAYSMQR